MENAWIVPQWAAPSNVRACVTTRQGGYSSGVYESMNVGNHVGDDPQVVAQNRELLKTRLSLPANPYWLNQVHGVQVIQLPWAQIQNANAGTIAVDADGSVTRRADQVCVVMTADCLPVLLCDRHGTTVGAVHAGWRGLAAGIIEAAVTAMNLSPQNVLAWLGPAIGPTAFEVGIEVRDAFVQYQPQAAEAFQPSEQGRWFADIYHLARLRLNHIGVQNVYGGGFCTYSDVDRFYSYRREKVTGRMASLIWLVKSE